MKRLPLKNTTLKSASLFAVCATALIAVACSSPDGAHYSASNPIDRSQGGTNTRPVAPCTITAGEWNDLSQWSLWLSLVGQQWQDVLRKWQIQPIERLALALTDADGKPLADAWVVAQDAQGNTLAEGKTDNAGNISLFPSLFSQQSSQSAPPPVGSAREIRVQGLAGGQPFNLGMISLQNTTAATQPVKQQVAVSQVLKPLVEIMMVVDATGSMGDEIQYLKVELDDVLTQARAQANMSTLRVASVFYRDRGDEYVTRPFAFTTDVSSLIHFIGQQSASGGGDFPEAVDEALDVAMKQDWSLQATSRLLFLVLDAPPHYTSGSIDRIQNAIRRASQLGVRIIPIVASGINKETEALMRSLAISTGGTYVFITNDSGVGNSHLQPTVGKYDVEFLNKLMLRLIVKYSTL